MKVPCQCCHEEVDELELYGEWGDYCLECWVDEGRDSELDENDSWDKDDED